MNPWTGLVSPQFNIKCDKRFESIENDKTEYTWKIKAGLTERIPSIASVQLMKTHLEKTLGIPATSPTISFHPNVTEAQYNSRDPP